MNSDPQRELILDLLAQWEESRQHGIWLKPQELCPEDEDLQNLLAGRIEELLAFSRLIESDRVPQKQSGPQFSVQSKIAEHKDSRPSSRQEFPDQIDRYRVIRVLGQGGFGVVYLAHDAPLDRLVAIKVPHPGLISSSGDVESFLKEARNVASLAHPQIVPVYDIGVTPQIQCYIVSRYIEGSDLSEAIRTRSITALQASLVIAQLADALHYAHLRGLVHRDIKPANILISKLGEPFLVDFGMALRDHEVGSGRRFAGTPAYMSPEQARGESHRVDGRSDLFSLGVVFYEILTGRKPFSGESHSDLLQQIISMEPKPLRQIDDRIPKELERICLRLIAKPACDRYTTGKDLAEELRDYSAQANTVSTDAVPLVQIAEPASTSVSNQIIPKGLRSFDSRDAQFFLNLLPGPYDRAGLPESLRFWKHRIESPVTEVSFAVGLIYGPSGCGKSSLIKAGLIPQLQDSVIPIYLEATASQTEVRLLRELRSHCVGLPEQLSLKEALAAVRAGVGIPPSTKILIVLDQFEQWLHAEQKHPASLLAQALRECDGCRLQCLILVRDDFWMSVTRFFGDLEIALVPGENSAVLDLFDLTHAERVLHAFGVAYGKLPKNQNEMSQEQYHFVNQAIQGLAENGRVICLRLALLAEMMKWKPWTASSLKEVGGHSGLGVTFLEETFSSRTAQPRHRLYSASARGALAQLLPASERDIQRRDCSRSELAVASGYVTKPQMLNELLSILDRELRLITPTDQPANSNEESTQDHAENSNPSFRLTHDFLVPALREWLFRKQRETRRGRAELLLAERSSLWNSKRDRRFLPSLIEVFSIGLWTRFRRWSDAERKMMAHAARTHFLTWGSFVALAVGLVVLAAVLKDRELRTKVRVAVDAVQNCRSDAILECIKKLDALPRDLIDEELKVHPRTNRTDQKLRLLYAATCLRPVDADLLCAEVGAAPWEELDLIKEFLGHSPETSVVALKAAAAKCDAEMTDSPLKEPLAAKSRLAIIALLLGEPSIAIDMCQIVNRPDPIQRTVFVETIAWWHGDLTELARVSRMIDSPALRSALSMGIVSIHQERIRDVEKAAWKPILSDWFSTAPQGVVHISAGLPILYWGLDIPEIKPSNVPVSHRDWFMNSMYMTFVRVPPMGSGPGALGSSITKTMPSFFLLDREVNVGQYGAFIADPNYPASEKPTEKTLPDFGHPSILLPAVTISYDDAVMFCNWLSSREGRSPAYQRRVEKVEDHLSQWKLVSTSSGYRLPTTEQWEFACRAGTTTQLFFGSHLFLLRYAQIGGTEPTAVTSRLPNGWGLCDMQGNVAEWCERSDNLPPCVMGGSFRTPIQLISPAIQWMPDSDRRENWIGFRVLLPDTITE